MSRPTPFTSRAQARLSSFAVQLALCAQRRRVGLWTTVLVAGGMGCGEIIGADFDPKTVYPGHFSDGGEGGTSGAPDETEGSGGKQSSVTKATGGSSNPSGGRDGTGGRETVNHSTGGSGSGGDGGAPSQLCSLGDVDCDVDVVLNEVRGQGGIDFIEIYNRGTDDVSLVGWSLTDGNQNDPSTGNRVIIPDEPDANVLETTIFAGGFLFFQAADEETVCVAENCGGFLSFGISAGGESVFLLDPDSQIIDFMDYPDEEAPGGLLNGQTLGRYPDGNDAVGAMSPPTPGAPNAPLD